MNVQRLIEKYKKKYSGESMSFLAAVLLNEILRDLEQLDETKPVKVKKFVADWIEKCKTELSLREAMSQANVSIEVNDWLVELDEDGVFLNQDIFARAWFYGYEIQETKYVVTDGNHLYFKNYQEDIEIVILVDEQPGTMEYVKKFDTKEEAQKAADILGWKVQEVE